MKLLINLLLLCLLAGCAGEKAVLKLNVMPSAQASRFFYPPETDGEVTRYVYIGELQGEQNFVDPNEKGPSVFMQVLKFIVGFFDYQDPQVLQRPQSGVVDEEGRILVTDVSRGAVYVFDENAGALDVWIYAEGFKTFKAPSGIALGPEGRVFVADADLKQVYLLDRLGNGKKLVAPDELQRPTGLAWDENASLLYVADTYAHQIKVFDMAGRLVRTIGNRGEEPGEFNFPTYLALSEKGLLVSDTMNARVQLIPLEEDGVPQVMGSRGTQFGQFVRPKGVATDGEGNIYVVESYHDHLLIFDSRGRFLLPIGGSGKEVGHFFLPSGVWVDNRNRVFVADTFNGRIMVFQFLGGGRESE